MRRSSLISQVIGSILCSLGHDLVSGKGSRQDSHIIRRRRPLKLLFFSAPTLPLSSTLLLPRNDIVKGLINQLKEAVPAMQKSIAELTEEVHGISPIALDEYNERSSSPTQAQSSGRIQQEDTDQLIEMASNLSLQAGKVSGSPLLKLPHLFSLTPNSSGKSLHAGKRHTAAVIASQSESIPTVKSVGQSYGNDYADVEAKDGYLYALNIRRAVREAALSGPSSTSEISDEKSSDESEHFFVPLSTSFTGKETDAVVSRRKEMHFSTPPDTVECLDQVFSPPFVMNDSFFEDAYEDLLAPLSETDAALMGSPSWLEGNSANTLES